jgi:hypothetical protein
MELDRKKVEDMAHQLWALMDSCRFVGYDLTKDKDRLKGQYTIHEIYATGDYKALRYDTGELEATKRGVHNALYEINRLKERCSKIIQDLDYFEGILKELDNE